MGKVGYVVAAAAVIGASVYAIPGVWRNINLALKRREVRTDTLPEVPVKTEHEYSGEICGDAYLSLVLQGLQSG